MQGLRIEMEQHAQDTRRALAVPREHDLATAVDVRADQLQDLNSAAQRADWTLHSRTRKCDDLSSTGRLMLDSIDFAETRLATLEQTQ